MATEKQCKNDGVVCDFTSSEDRKTGNRYRSARIMTEDGLVVIFTHTKPLTVNVMLGEEAGGTFENGHRQVIVYVNNAGQTVTQIGGQNLTNLGQVPNDLLKAAHKLMDAGKVNSSEASALFQLANTLAARVPTRVAIDTPEITPPKGLPAKPLIDPSLLKK